MIDVVVVGGVYREIVNGDTMPRSRIGGSGLTAATVASRLGAKTALVSYVGEEDEAVATVILEAANVDSRGVLKMPGASGTFVLPTELGKGRPWPMYRPAEAVPVAFPVIPEARVYLVFGFPDVDPIALGWLDAISESGLLIWDRQGWLSRARDWRGAAVLRPRRKVYLANEDEALAEFDARTEEELVLKLPPPGYGVAIVKRGRLGCIVLSRNPGGLVREESGAFVVECDSSLGSGDVFAGALAAKLGAGSTMGEAALVANAAASSYLEEGGNTLADALLTRLESRIKSLKDAGE